MTLPPTLGARLAASARPLVGMWVCSGSALNAEIAAGSGLDLVVIDTEHAPNDLPSVLAQLQAVAATPATAVVRAPIGDQVMIKQLLDLGAQNLIVPMVESAEHAVELVQAMRYPPAGVRGVGSALARSSRWNRIDGYLADAATSVSLTVQIESAAAVAIAADLAAVEGVGALLVGPADLAASMGHLGDQAHAEVVDAVLAVIDVGRRAGAAVGVNAFDPVLADRYLAAGAAFVLVGADVTLLARGSEALAARFIEEDRP